MRIAVSAEGPQARPPRLGISIRRAVVGSSVRRNRWKRWIREAFRLYGRRLSPGCDVVVSVVKDWPAARYDDVEHTLIAAMAQQASRSAHRTSS